MLVSSLIATIKTVTSLSDRVDGALDFAEMIKRKALPNVTPAAYVIPLGMNGRGNGEASAGAFVQNIDDTFGVMLIMRTSGDVTGAKTQPRLETLIEEIILAVVGTGPSTEPGVFSFRRGRLISMKAGTIFYQLDFSIHKQIRKL